MFSAFRIRSCLTRSLPTALAAVLLWLPSARAEPARYMRHPALSPDGRQVAFSYRGDIWTVAVAGGTARRITVHPARDHRPIWSPDGTQLAFASDREGQTDVYTMPSQGGAPVRRTFNTGSDYPCDWSPDGGTLLVESNRVWRPDLFEVPLDGGPPWRVTGVSQEGEYQARYDRAGKNIVYCDGAGYVRWWWEGLKSGRAGQVWKLARDSWPPRSERITPEGTQFLWPGWSDGDVIATSNAGEAVNIVRFENAQGPAVPVTNYMRDGVSWLRTSRDGKQAVFERQFRLWRIDFSTDSVSEIVVEAPSDVVASPRETESIQDKVEEFTLSPDGRRIAFIARGELYLMATDEPERAVRLTRTDARERFCVFSPDGREIAYVSDRTGRQNLYVIDTRSRAERRLTDFERLDVARPQWPPSGDGIACYLSNDRIVRIDPGAAVDPTDTLRRTPVDTLLLGRFFDFPLESTQEFRFSPDGRYIAYTAFGSDYNTDIWIYALDGSELANTTRWSRYNYDPRWSPDGRYLTFTHSDRTESDVFALRLMPEAPEFAESRLDSLYDSEAETSGDRDDEDDSVRVEIDFDDMHERWEPVMPMAASQQNLVQSPDGKYWLFVADLPGGTNIWRAPVAPDSEDKPMQLTAGTASKADLIVDPDSKWVYYLEGGRIGRVNLEGQKQKLYAFAADYDYQPDLRNAQKLAESWRMLGNYFYDPDMHGARWDSVFAAYSAVVPHVALEEELRELMRQMIGQLNASHLNIYGGTPGLPTASQSGYPGVVFNPASLRQGRYVAERVLAEGPAAEAENPVAPADTLVAFDGQTLTPHTDLDSLWVGTIGERVRLTWHGARGEFVSDLKPVSRAQAATLVYDDWVASRRRLVDSMSSGRLGYLHIRAMNQPALERFQRQLADQTSPYDGLIVDVRYNGGGWISVHLLGMLEREPFVLRNFRGQATVSENKSRAYAVEKPMILLMNHFSASNSEIMAEGWRQLGLGKIVGYPTSAAVIGTAGYRLIDGTICRRPSWGAFTVDMENLEGTPRRPDIEIFNTQYDWITGRDPQLEAAVEELLAELR